MKLRAIRFMDERHQVIQRLRLTIPPCEEKSRNLSLILFHLGLNTAILAQANSLASLRR